MYECTAYMRHMSDQDRARHQQRQTAGALRARRSRARRRAGTTVFHIEADQRRVIAALRAAGRRLADDASRKEIEHALAEVVSDFTRRWLGKEKTVRVTRTPPSAGLCSRHGPAISA
jgi:5-formyltetrahydrofolate cyclo-ligase